MCFDECDSDLILHVSVMVTAPGQQYNAPYGYNTTASHTMANGNQFGYMGTQPVPSPSQYNYPPSTGEKY